MYKHMFINPNNPVYNTVIFYILIICIILIMKPEFMYCNKSNKFKSFGCDEGQTLWSFSVVSVGIGVILYVFFIGVEHLHNYLSA